MTVKICRKCNQELDISHFYKSVNDKDGIRPDCRQCHINYCKANYANNKLIYNKRSGNRKKNNKKLIDEFKSTLCCSKCGYNKCIAALHFHHINPEEKDFSISRACNVGMSIKNIMLEIDKCIVLCANCHIEEHYKPE